MPEQKRPKPPTKDVRELQDPEHTEDDFLRDLEKASTDQAKERLADERDPASPRTSE